MKNKMKTCIPGAYHCDCFWDSCRSWLSWRFVVSASFFFPWLVIYSQTMYGNTRPLSTTSPRRLGRLNQAKTSPFKNKKIFPRESKKKRAGPSSSSFLCKTRKSGERLVYREPRLRRAFALDMDHVILRENQWRKARGSVAWLLFIYPSLCY